jgi:hypothetical protein
MQQDEVLAQPNVLLRMGARIACFTEERHPLPTPILSLCFIEGGRGPACGCSTPRTTRARASF